MGFCIGGSLYGRLYASRFLAAGDVLAQPFYHMMEKFVGINHCKNIYIYIYVFFFEKMIWGYLLICIIFLWPKNLRLNIWMRNFMGGQRYYHFVLIIYSLFTFYYVFDFWEWCILLYVTSVISTPLLRIRFTTSFILFLKSLYIFFCRIIIEISRERYLMTYFGIKYLDGIG